MNNVHDVFKKIIIIIIFLNKIKLFFFVAYDLIYVELLSWITYECMNVVYKIKYSFGK